MIANLEKVVHFLKTEIETKNEPIKNFRITMFLEMGKFRYLHAYQVTKNTNIDKQLKAIREEKHKEYLQNTSRKSPPRENIVIETNEKNDRDETNEQPNDTHDKNEVKNKQDEREYQSC